MAKATANLSGRDILDLASLSVDEYELIMQTATEMKKIMKRDIKKVPSLRGKTIVNMFYENSTRTRTSFELAGKFLGADVINISTTGSSVAKGECLRDTLLTLEAMHCDAIVMRHPVEGSAKYAADIVKPVIINGGDGAHGFAVDEESIKGLPIEVTNRSLNDGTIEGVRYLEHPTFTVQYHPEASPGPSGHTYLFKRFIKMMGGH